MHINACECNVPCLQHSPGMCPPCYPGYPPYKRFVRPALEVRDIPCQATGLQQHEGYVLKKVHLWLQRKEAHPALDNVKVRQSSVKLQCVIQKLSRFLGLKRVRFAACAVPYFKTCAFGSSAAGQYKLGAQPLLRPGMALWAGQGGKTGWRSSRIPGAWPSCRRAPRPPANPTGFWCLPAVKLQRSRAQKHLSEGPCAGLSQPRRLSWPVQKNKNVCRG